MFPDFLSTCTPVLASEKADFQRAAAVLSQTTVSIGLLPAVIDDLYPVVALRCTSAGQIVSPNVYLVPVRGSSAQTYFEEIVRKFYQEDEIRERDQVELEEMILLHQADVCRSFSLDPSTSYNVLYCHLRMSNGLPVYLFVLPMDADACWKDIIEPYDLKCDILIDSHKGLGNWLDYVPLYAVLLHTERTELLPPYYFKGLYISHDAPHGFQRIYTIPEQIISDGRYVDDQDKEIYSINWVENRKHT